MRIDYTCDMSKIRGSSAKICRTLAEVRECKAQIALVPSLEIPKAELEKIKSQFGG